jgi:tRNA(Ile)-lysidine synthase
MTASEIITKYAPKTAKVGVGVSGGADSMVLLYFAVQTLGKDRVVALHIEHGIRGEQSKLDAEFVRVQCEKTGVEFRLFSVDIPTLAKENKRSEESEARIFRHQVYSDFANENASVVLLGHHKDDRKESVLMHILRGSAIKGLVGMSESDGHILRPLLYTSKAEIVDFANANGIPFVQDETNFSLDYDRNYVRNVLIPAIDERYDSDALLRLSDNARENEEFVGKFINEDNLIMDDGAVLLPLECLKDKALATRYILKAFALAGFTYDMESKHLNDTCALKEMENGAKICLPRSFVAIKEYDFIAVYKERKAIDYEIEFSLGFTPLDFGLVSILQTDEKPSKGKLIFDADKIPYNAVIRNRREGDVFKPYNGKTKKLKDYFIDKKVPLRKRDFIPVIAVDNEVLLVSQMEISDKIKVDESTTEKYEFVYEKD